MTREEVAKRPEFQRLRLTAAAYSSAMRLVTRAYAIDLGIIDPRVTAELLTDHATDQISRREVLSRLNSEERIAIGLADIRRLKT